ncbi:ubiquitin carboxyl-terminal hydrolase 1 [Eublepharis macularius]|uniref:Ubiquitin carboxyl-terminal hydrolase n=1 Tax=Eublepharis macularius TaxID=481883 RepID=A0AA97JFC3_EUBMA|nr:ubiquitin carboxyl-terminal hydrolase 1 [Eublepharis macularius]XP_054836248.1 ubiquitin carboxyl-terminal hydrolase 1 [Eublepharis macularius]XP_054836249.1 ubiquitin carboxyl-terminal hydrolase 1 [Eublepharis macularius]
MPGVLPCDSNGLSRETPSKKSRLSLKFFQKRETKRALDFTESQENEDKSSENVCSEIDHVIPATQLLSTVHCEKKVNMLPFVGLNNLGNTCYLNSILQVLYFCPGFKTGVKLLSNIISQKKENLKEEIGKGIIKEDSLASYELVCSLHSLIVSVEQLQTSFLLNPDRYTDELATPPRRLLNTLRELNPMYEGYLQHDAQEVLQCILGHIDKTCQLLKEELKPVPPEESTVQLENRSSKNTDSLVTPEEAGTMINWQAVDNCEDKNKGSGKRKNDMEGGNEKKKSKVSKEKNEVENRRETRSKRFSKRKALEEKPENQAEATIKYPKENESTKPTPKKSRLKLNWLKSSSNQPSILSKFCRLGKLSTNLGFRDQIKEIETCEVKEVSLKNENGNQTEEKYCDSWSPVESTSEKETAKPHKTDTEMAIFNLVEKLFQGQLVLRTRCLECECFTERREDFQDISVPVQKDEVSKVEENFEISPEPKTEVKTLKWAISQFASVERIVGEDKYFCENCRHYTEAERSLLFDKMPEVITIHLKCFAATGLEFDCYGGLSKINTPLLTPLELSLDDWSIKPANEIYGLFAVVMHSGITISSGHYTASVKITNLSSLELDKENFITDPQCEMTHSEPLKEQEARTVTEDYDDGEVSFKVSGNTQPNKGLNKKNIEAVGLLGGQKSKPACDLLSSKATHSGMIVTETRNAEWNHATGIVEVEHHDQPGMASNGPESKSAHIMQSLKEYEGKWLLFDDSEVKVTEEKDFLNSLSPVSSSTSTPYLLFYKKMVE